MSHGRHRGLIDRARPGVFLTAPCWSEDSAAAVNAKEQALKGRHQAILPANKTGGTRSVDVGVGDLRSRSECSMADEGTANEPQPGGHAVLWKRPGLRPGDHVFARSRTPAGGAQMC